MHKAALEIQTRREEYGALYAGLKEKDRMIR